MVGRRIPRRTTEGGVRRVTVSRWELWAVGIGFMIGTIWWGLDLLVRGIDNKLEKLEQRENDREEDQYHD
ncbi:MAG: hypothetical protein LZF86_140011 [Nitrospira sp.]|nr:MAG: hypothetical protein LZF86_140011 [Nitrospira sp.]